jgi:hypothetical protein
MPFADVETRNSFMLVVEVIVFAGHEIIRGLSRSRITSSICEPTCDIWVWRRCVVHAQYLTKIIKIHRCIDVSTYTYTMQTCINFAFLADMEQRL